MAHGDPASLLPVSSAASLDELKTRHDTGGGTPCANLPQVGPSLTVFELIKEMACGSA